MERRKQDAALVGLTRDQRGRVDPRGRIVTPESRIGERQAAEQLTRVSDVLTLLVEGYQRGVMMVDTAEVSDCLTIELEAQLRKLWPTSPIVQRTVGRWRSRPRDPGAL